MASLRTVTFSRREIYREARRLGNSITASAWYTLRNGPMKFEMTTLGGEVIGNDYVVSIASKRV